MKRLILAASLAVASLPAFAQVSGTISIGQPGFYGQIDIGDYPAPRYYNPQPIVIERVVVAEPVYLRVPPGHRKNWAKHCYKYNACGRQTYFVQDSWYNTVYVPQYRERHRDHDNNGHGHDKHHGKGHGKKHKKD